MSMNANQVVSAILFALDTAISLSDSSERLRQLVAKAVKEGRTLTNQELETLSQEARAEIKKARDND